MTSVKYKFAVIADPHYYSETLGNSGKAYDRRQKSDQKLLAETKGTVKAALDAVAESDAEFLLIAGDLSNDGELCSHREIRELLYEFRKKKPVYVITATHDWCCDNNPRRYVGDKILHDVATVAVDELRDFYKDFGPDASIAEYFTHLNNSSYVIRPADGISVFCLNDDQNGEGGSGYSKEHFDWISEQIKAAKQRGDIIFGMQHHHLFLTELDRVINSQGGIEYREKMITRFADEGFHVMFTGHSHMQHIRKFTTEKGNDFYEVNVASISGYPAPIVYCTADESGIDIKTEHLEKFIYNGRYYYADLLKEHATALFSDVIDAALRDDKYVFAALLEAVDMKNEKAFKLWKVARPLLKELDKLTVKKAAKIINGFTFGKGINKAAAAEIGETKVKDIIFEAFLSILDGSLTTHERGSAYYTVFTDALSLPLKIMSDLHINKPSLIRKLSHLRDAADEIMTGGPLDNNNYYIKF